MSNVCIQGRPIHRNNQVKDGESFLKDRSFKRMGCSGIYIEISWIKSVE